MIKVLPITRVRDGSEHVLGVHDFPICPQVGHVIQLQYLQSNGSMGTISARVRSFELRGSLPGTEIQACVVVHADQT